MDIKIQRLLSDDTVVYRLLDYSLIAENIARMKLSNFIKPEKVAIMSIETEEDFEKVTGQTIQSQVALFLIGCSKDILEKIMQETIRIVFI